MDDKTIRFIDSDYKELFRIPEGGSITVTYPPGDGREPATRTCEFLDEMHTKIGGNVYHICEFAERMEAIGARYEPTTQLHNVEIKPFEAGEEKFYTYNRDEGNTCIGHIAGEFGQSGDRYFSNWSDRENDRNTPEFQTELHSAVYALRQDLLRDYNTMLAYCQSHPEAKLDSGDKFTRYGFKLETDTRQYFVSCFFGEQQRDARFIVYAYDNEAPVLEVETAKKSYTLEELIKIMEPQAQRDKALISACIGGLGLYASQQAQFNPQSSKTDELRGLVVTLVSYWGLDEGENAKTAEDFLYAFDDRIAAAKSGERVTMDVSGYQDSTIYGLYRYGMEMVVAQGDSAMGDILSVGNLIQEIGTTWDYEPYTAIDDLTARLTTEVRGLLDNITLPGQPMSDEMVQRYEIKQAVLFDNDRGFALAHNPAAPSPFVTWQFTNDNGVRDYYWGRYCGTEERAKVDYLSRVSDYRETYHLPEKPIPTTAAEMSREQNYNMIDGLHNNEPAPRADLTDGQTLEEIKELAPEMLPAEKPSVLDRIRDARENPQPHKEKDTHTHARDKEDLSL